ncbi:MAG: hypothetical protein ACM3ZV_02430 [Bacillota bacterium]
MIAAIAACGRQDPVANGANAVTALPAANHPGAPMPAGGPPRNHGEAPAVPASGATAPSIPAALQGRWGLTPADCTSPLGDAKGLLVVNATELRFYESRALPTADVQASKQSMNGDFRFTGEGQTWTKYEALQRNGDRLTRSETNPAASYTYAKC